MQQRLNDEIDETRKMVEEQGELVDKMHKDFEKVKNAAAGDDEDGEGGGGKISLA